MLQQSWENMNQSIRDHIEASCFVDMSRIEDDASFMETGILDSVGFLEMVAFLERTFHLKIKDDELVPSNMDSISSILNYLNVKKKDLPRG
jgi:acyl carrier protein